MFKANTVFILGAGASWHYGYPTGEELVKQVISKARTARKYFTEYVSNSAPPLANSPRIVCGSDPTVPKDDDAGLRKQWTAATDKCQDLIDRLNAADPLEYDSYYNVWLYGSTKSSHEELDAGEEQP